MTSRENDNVPNIAHTANRRSNMLTKSDRTVEKPSPRKMNGDDKQCNRSDSSGSNKEKNGNMCNPKSQNTDNVRDVSQRYDEEMTIFGQFIGKINRFRNQCGNFVNQEYVQLFIVLLIGINAIMMGIGTYSFVRNDDHLTNIFDMVDLVFLIFFTVELGLQFIYHGLGLLLDGWLVFDLVIIVTSWSFASAQIIRAFRIFRALRLVTRIKVLKNLILALFGVVPRMAAIGMMLVLIFYIFAVMFTQLFDDLQDTEYNYFGGMGFTLFTLFQMMTLDNWASICREVMSTHSWAWVPFICFIIVSGFIIVNLMVAVICDAIASLHQSDKAKLQGKYTDDGDSQVSAPLEIREQLDCLEEQMEELTRIQARTFHTLQYLTRQMQMHKLKKELASKNTVADAARNLKKVQRQLSQKGLGLSIHALSVKPPPLSSQQCGVNNIDVDTDDNDT